MTSPTSLLSVPGAGGGGGGGDEGTGAVGVLGKRKSEKVAPCPAFIILNLSVIIITAEYFALCSGLRHSQRRRETP